MRTKESNDVPINVSNAVSTGRRIAMLKSLPIEKLFNLCASKMYGITNVRLKYFHLRATRLRLITRGLM